ncbi:hypothetical protein Pcinc_034473 [Petrolisthes cinctipes]|uniref:Uncharacterized protein n=1 Tax=Petrolisthes cinctipes TaxID=88211 RepID=A0AAE1EQ64_PETCI|nr:hypothetical protein Pcinc_034473 [Petrolisthes cinctipes]
MKHNMMSSSSRRRRRRRRNKRRQKPEHTLSTRHLDDPPTTRLSLPNLEQQKKQRGKGNTSLRPDDNTHTSSLQHKHPSLFLLQPTITTFSFFPTYLYIETLLIATNMKQQNLQNKTSRN